MLKDLGILKGKIALFGGAYSNIEALHALEKTLIEKDINQTLNTGDIVGYCANPQEAVEFVKEKAYQGILGNVEIQLRDDLDDCGCDFSEESRCDIMSKQWYPFAKQNTSKEALDWFKTLPDQITFTLGSKRVLVLHGGIENVSEFIFKSTPWAVKENYFTTYKVDIIIAGHCGLPFVDSNNGKHWINPGVIGMPANDGQQNTWYGILDENSFELCALNYDWHLTQEKMLLHKLPKPYATTLETGIWDNMDILPETEQTYQVKAIQPFKVNF